MRLFPIFCLGLFFIFPADLLFAMEFDANNIEDAVVAYRLPLITIPFLSKPPAIDGGIGPEEWKQAANLTGMHTQVAYLGGSGIMADDQSTVWLGYDEKALYIAFHTERPAYARIPKADYVPDEAESSEKGVWADDCLEILVKPGETNYHFAVNSKGFHGDGILRSSTDRSWRGQWESPAQLTPDGWECEIRIPFATIGENTPSEGSMWRLFLMRNNKTPEKGFASLSYLTGWGKPDEYARIIFGGSEKPVVRVSEIGSVNLDDAGVNIEIQSPKKEQNLIVEASIYRKRDDVISFMGENKLDTKEGILIPITVDWAFYQKFLPEGWEAALDTTVPVESWKEQITVPAGQQWSTFWKTPAQAGKYLCSYSVKDAETGRIIAARAMPFEKKTPLRLTVEPWVLMAKEIRIEVQYDKSLAKNPELQVAVDITKADSKEKLYENSVPIDILTQLNIMTIPSQGYMGKELQITAKLIKPDGTDIYEVSKKVTIPDIPEWMDNGYGISDDVPEPWMPVKFSGDKATVILRDYILGQNGLPKQIISLNKELLAGPIELMFDGKTLLWKRSTVDKKDKAVVWKSRARMKNCNIELLAALEFDGMIRYDLTLRPSGSTSIKNLELVIPYRSNRNIEKLPIVRYEFQPHIELGDFETGLCWAAEWYKGWQVGKKPLIEIQSAGEKIDWRVRFFGQEGKTITEPVTITWILHALPVKSWNTDYLNRRSVTGLGGGGESDYLGTGQLPSVMTENCLRYPLKKNLDPRAGSICFHLVPGDTLNIPKIQVLQIPAEGDNFTLLYERRSRKGDRWPYKQSLVLYKGKQEIARIFPIMRRLDTPWLPVGISWQAGEQETKITLLSVNSHGSLITAEGAIDSNSWGRMLDGNELVFGGKQSIGLDDICIRNIPLNPQEFTSIISKKAELDSSVLLLDNLDRLDFWQARYISRPQRIMSGSRGIAGAPLLASFVEKIDGRFGKAVLLPAGLYRTAFDYAGSLGSRMVYPNHGQWQSMCGYYSPNFVPDPVLQQKWLAFLKKGFGVTVYNGFAFEPELDPMIGPYMSELARRPIRLVYSAHVPCLATPAADYYIRGLKKSIDSYGIQGVHLDGTFDCKSICIGQACGCGWMDDSGKPQGRHTIFANREIAKRYYQLLKNYRKEKFGEVGFIGLHSGAAGFSMVAGFADICKLGEGGEFSSSNFARSLMLPEDYGLFISSRRMGVPVEILTKGDNMPYGPNYLYLYTLLYDMGLRTYSKHLFPEYWHMDPAKPQPLGKDVDYSKLPPFNPYGAEIGVSSYPLPTVLWWMLRDDFGYDKAEFLPFWRNGDLLSADNEKVRCSAWLHKGESMLIAVCNFAGEPVDVMVRVNWKAMYLDCNNLAAFDGFTGENYTLSSEGIKVPINNGPYRLIRVEAVSGK